MQDGRIYIAKINGPFLYVDKAHTGRYAAGLALAIERGWLELHDSGTFVRFTQSRRGPIRVGLSTPELRGRCSIALPG